MSKKKAIGPSFSEELTTHGGLMGQHFTWSPDGTIEFFPDTPESVVSGVESVYAAHDPAKIPLSTQAKSALQAGVDILSAGAPALDAVYACDPVSQMDIMSIETSLNAGRGFPGGADTFEYPDVNGVMHSFSESNFADFASAVRGYVYALNSVIAGAATDLPGTPVAIP